MVKAAIAAFLPPLGGIDDPNIMAFGALVFGIFAALLALSFASKNETPARF